MTEKLRLAIAGAGLAGRRHAQAISHTVGAELVAIVDPDPEAKEFAYQRNIQLFSQLDVALVDAEIDGMILSTPTPLHVDQAEACIDSRIPVLIEKPISVTFAEAQALVLRAGRDNVPVLVGHHRRHNPIIRAAYDRISAGDIGTLRAIHVHCWFYKPDSYFDKAPWRKKRGAGPISVNLVHDMDLIRHLCGEILNVQAQATPSQRGFENEDVAAALLRFENGAIATITVSDSIAAPWSWELTSGEYPIYPKTQESCYWIGGSKGSLSIPDLRLWRHAAKPDWWSPISATSAHCDFSDPLLNQMRHFCDVIRGDADPLVSGWEGLRTLQVVEAVQKSAATGESVAIEPIDPVSRTSTRIS